VYNIRQLDGNGTMQVYCDMITDGGAWVLIIIQKRIDGSENFYKTWSDYVEYFRNLPRDFWLE